MVLPQEHVVTFITSEAVETNYIEISEVQSVESQCKNWIAPKKLLPKVPMSDFLLSSGSVTETRKYDLPESDISNETCENFAKPLEKYKGALFSGELGHRSH